MEVLDPQKAASFNRTLASARSTLGFSEIFRLAVDSFRASKVRFLLTMLGMIFGVAAVVATPSGRIPCWNQSTTTSQRTGCRTGRTEKR